MISLPPLSFRQDSVQVKLGRLVGVERTRSIVYKGWLTRDEIWRLVDFEKILRDGDYFYK